MKKILPIVDPPIKGYPDFAYMLSVILNYQEGYEWLYCNYIQLIYDEVDLKNSIRFYTPDYNGTTWRPLNTTLCYQLLERNTILDLNINVVDYITYAIDNGFYAMMFVDEFYIPNRWAYKKMPYHHVLFIYGYDKENEMFYTAGYDARMTYTTDLLSFENFVEGFKNDKESIFFENNCIRLMKHDIARYKYKFSPSVVVEQLEEFLYSKDSSLKYGTDFTKQRNVFGIKTYDALIRYLKTTVAYHWEGNLKANVHHNGA